MNLGRIVTAPMVDGWIRDTIVDHLPAYLDAVAQDAAVTVTPPTAVRIRQDLEWWPEDRLPLLVVVTRGVTFTRTAGEIDGVWESAVGVFVNGRGVEDTRAHAMRVTAAVRALLIHHQTLGGRVDAINVTDEDFEVLDADESRTVSAAAVGFQVLTRGVTDLTPPDDGPVVRRHEETINPLEGA